MEVTRTSSPWLNLLGAQNGLDTIRSIINDCETPGLKRKAARNLIGNLMPCRGYPMSEELSRVFLDLIENPFLLFENTSW